MNQDDFRKLLDGGGGARGGRRHGGGNASKGNITSLDADGIRKLSATKSSKKKNHKPFRQDKNDDSDDDRARAPQLNQYRDRAAERRQGVTVDRPDTNVSVGPSKALKGIDFNLLTQLKQEKLRLEQATAAAKMQQMTMTEDLVQETSDVDMDAEPTFQARLGRMVYLQACQSQTLSKSELFLPGRMYYTFNLLSTDFESIPLAVQRSKDDCAELDDVVSGLVDDMTLSEVRRVMEEKHSKKARRKRDESNADDAEEKLGVDEVDTIAEDQSKALKEPVIDDEDDDLDIFPDAGEYVPAYLREEEAPNTANVNASHDYFSNLSASLTAAEREARRKEQEAEEAWKATLKKAAAAQSQAEKEEAMRARAAKLAAAQDAYGEDYEMGGGDDSDDDEEQSSKKRKDAKKATEVDDEEKTRRKKQKQGNKLENDLKKINKLMESKT